MSKEENKKKKLIRVEGFKTTYGQTPQTISFSLVSKTEEGRKQVMKFLSCRDHLNDALHSRVHDGSCGFYSSKTNLPIDLDKLRLIIGRHFGNKENREKFVENIFSAKRLLNFYEGVANWEKSKITTVKHSILKYNAWLITGPKEWVSYPNLLSLITLIFRIIGNHGPIKFSNNEDIEKWFYDLMQRYEKEQHNSTIFQYDYDLQSHLPCCWDKLYMIMKYHKEIFTEPMEKMFTANMEIHSRGGIVQLCRCSTDSTVLDENMRKVYDEFAKEKYRTMDSDGTAYKLHSEFVAQKKTEDVKNRSEYEAKAIW